MKFHAADRFPMQSVYKFPRRAIGRRVVVVRVLIKKTQKTPDREIELALKRAKEISR